MQDVNLVRSLMQRHVRHTGSPLAKSLLSKWETVQPHFIKVYPHEYRHAMEEAEKTKVCAFLTLLSLLGVWQVVP